MNKKILLGAMAVGVLVPTIATPVLASTPEGENDTGQDKADDLDLQEVTTSGEVAVTTTSEKVFDLKSSKGFQEILSKTPGLQRWVDNMDKLEYTEFVKHKDLKDGTYEGEPLKENGLFLDIRTYGKDAPQWFENLEGADKNMQKTLEKSLKAESSGKKGKTNLGVLESPEGDALMLMNTSMGVPGANEYQTNVFVVYEDLGNSTYKLLGFTPVDKLKTENLLALELPKLEKGEKANYIYGYMTLDNFGKDNFVLERFERVGKETVEIKPEPTPKPEPGINTDIDPPREDEEDVKVKVEETEKDEDVKVPELPVDKDNATEGEVIEDEDDKEVVAEEVETDTEEVAETVDVEVDEDGEMLPQTNTAQSVGMLAGFTAMLIGGAGYVYARRQEQTEQ